MRSLKRWATGRRSFVILALACGVTIAVGLASRSLAMSSPPHTNHYQLSFEATGTKAGDSRVYFAIDGVSAYCHLGEPAILVDGGDKKAGDTVGIRVYNPDGSVDRSGTLTLKNPGALGLGYGGCWNITVRVDLETISGKTTWVIRVSEYCC
jgi:hypothetical protein